MQKKVGPSILIGLLLLILFFTLGVKLGQKVEKTNKVIDFIVSLTPSPKPSPKVEKSIKYLSYTSKICGIKFLYPGNLITKESSTSAFFQNPRGERSISIDCSINNKIKEEKLATSEAVFKNKKIIVQKKTDNNTLFFIFNVKNPKNLKNISITIEDTLYPLFESTLQYVNE